MDVYKASAFEDRVNYAASCIAKSNGVPQGRAFDTCFEMGDAEFVAAALVRRVISHPNTKLAAKLFQAINKELALANYETTKHLTRAELAREAIRETVNGCRKIGYTNL